LVAPLPVLAGHLPVLTAQLLVSNSFIGII